jgi:hypothetical protein
MLKLPSCSFVHLKQHTLNYMHLKGSKDKPDTHDNDKGAADNAPTHDKGATNKPDTQSHRYTRQGCYG